MSDARIDRLEQEVRSLRRALYGMAAVSLALGSVAVASCSKSAESPKKLVFTDGKAETTIDATGLHVTDEEHSISISGGTGSDEDPGASGDNGGCSAGGSGGASFGLALALLALRRRPS